MPPEPVFHQEMLPTSSLPSQYSGQSIDYRYLDDVLLAKAEELMRKLLHKLTVSFLWPAAH